MPFRERLTYRLLALLVVLGFTLLWVLGRDIQIGDNTYHPDAIAALLVAAGAVALYMFPQTSSWVDKPIFGTGQGITKPVEKDPIKANREELLKAVDQTWLSGLLDHLLNQQESLKIGLEALEPDKLAQRMGGQPYPLTDNQAVLKAFNDFGRKLVLLGEPGAGKTVLMMQLARLLWSAAKRDEHERIPMIFPLASWASKQPPFEEWLKEEFHNRYGVPEKLAKALVESEQVIFLLDGLDEVAVDYREACLKAIKAFVEDKNRRVEYVVCSRRTEFAALQTRLNVPGEIVLQPLTMEQILGYLKKEPFAALRELLTINAIVRDQFAPVPFMLNTMAYVTRGESVEGLRRLLADRNTEASLRGAFLDEYVTQRLAEKPNAKYTNVKTRHWLHWLAEQLIKHDETDFYLENMQPDWLATDSQTQRWRLVVQLVIGLVVGLVFGLLGGLVGGLMFGLMSGLLYGVVIGWLWRVSTKQIDMSDQLRWTFARSQLVFSLMVAAVFGLTAVLLIGLERGLGLGLAFGLLGGLVVGLNPQSTLRYRVRPGQGIQRSLWNGLFIMLVVGLGFVLTDLDWRTIRLVNNLVLGIGFVLVGELALRWVGEIGSKIGNHAKNNVVRRLGGELVGKLGGRRGSGINAFINHYTLRWMLAREGNLPFYRYDKFLDYANDLVILRKVGGGYRFTHDMLRQHLAGTSTPKADS